MRAAARVLLILVAVSLLDGYATPSYECGLDGEHHYVPCSNHGTKLDTPWPEITTPDCECEFYDIACKLPTTKKDDRTVAAAVPAEALRGGTPGSGPHALLAEGRRPGPDIFLTHCALRI